MLALLSPSTQLSHRTAPIRNHKSTVLWSIHTSVECKYEKEPWGECDPASGLQKRTLKLKANLQGTQCEPTKEFTKQCSKKGNSDANFVHDQFSSALANGRSLFSPSLPLHERNLDGLR